MEHAHTIASGADLVILGLLGLCFSRGKGFAFFIILIGLAAAS